MFNETDPELEAKASGFTLLAMWAAAMLAGWSLAIAAYFFISRVDLPALAALWRHFQ